jgi:hypothetical protein
VQGEPTVEKISKSSNGKTPKRVGKNANETEKKAERPDGGKAVKKEPRQEKKLLRLNLQCLLQKLDAAKNAPKRSVPEDDVEYWIGIDLEDKKSNYCIMDKNADIVAEGSLATTVTEFGEHFKALPRCRIALEVGTHSPWTSALLEGLGHFVCVANPRKIGGGKKNGKRKNDKLDARALARLLKADPTLLYPIQHRGEEARHALVLLRARHAAVSARTKLICAVRGLVKSGRPKAPSVFSREFPQDRAYVGPGGFAKDTGALVQTN